MSRAADSLWRPASPCGAGCLPGPDTGVRLLRAARLAALCGVLVGAVLLLPVLPFGRGRAVNRSRSRGAVARLCARGVLAALGVRVSLPGARPRSGAGVLLVANHISWLDVVALLAFAPDAVMLAKREVRDWPVFGVLAAASGTIFVDRSRPRALPGTVAEAARRLRAGAVVVAFPEGTTWCGGAVGRFRPALFQAALDAGAAVAPVSVSYRLGAAPTVLAAYVGQETLWSSVRRVAAARGLTVRVEVHPTLCAAAGADRRALAHAAEAAVRAAVAAG